jgi:S1-C subfamily serine protease
MSGTEDRLRSALADAARTVRPETLRPLTVAAPDRPRSTRWIVPLVAAVSAGVLVAGVATLRDQGAGRRHETGPVYPPATSVPPPDVSAVTSARVRAATRGVLRITATAPACGRKTVGTGFVYASERVMTNAHIVAGSRGPVEVSLPSGGRRYQATVVLYDPRRDVAVLAVPGLRAPVLTLNPAGASRAAAVIAGYPSSSALVANPARIRARQIAVGPDIYRSPSPVRREIFSLRANVPDGRSGAPVLATDGTVYGMVFATALADDETAYALTAKEITPDAQAGRTADQAVPTQGCSS